MFTTICRGDTPVTSRKQPIDLFRPEFTSTCFLGWLDGVHPKAGCNNPTLRNLQEILEKQSK